MTEELEKLADELARKPGSNEAVHIDRRALEAEVAIARIWFHEFIAWCNA